MVASKHVIWLPMLIWLCFFDFDIFNTRVGASQSGIYVDNGVDQTVMQRLLDEDDKRQVSYEILEFLGLTKRPAHVHLSLRKSAPQFLLDVYHKLKEEENGILTNRSKRDLPEQNNFITDLDKKAIDQSDIIMTFLNKTTLLKTCPYYYECEEIFGDRIIANVIVEDSLETVSNAETSDSTTVSTSAFREMKLLPQPKSMVRLEKPVSQKGIYSRTDLADVLQIQSEFIVIKRGQIEKMMIFKEQEIELQKTKIQDDKEMRTWELTLKEKELALIDKQLESQEKLALME